MKDYGREFVNYLKAVFNGSAVGFSLTGGTTPKTLTVTGDATISATPATLGANTFTADQTYGTDVQAVLIAPTTDGHCTGVSTSAFVSGYTSSAVGDLVYLDSSSKWQKCDANTLALYNGLLGIALTVAATDATLSVALPGSMVRATGFPTFTVGSPVYMSETAGAVTHTQPTTTDAAIRMIGWGMQADTLYFFPSPDYITHT